MDVVTRFAPSPTGLLHLGHAYAAFNAWRRARDAGGRFLLRLEDIDVQRCRPSYASAIQDDLAWLGLLWDGPIWVQSEHFSDYRRVLEQLDQLGLTYPCFCTRSDIAASVAAAHSPGVAPAYPGTCRRLPAQQRADRIAAGYPFALRLDMQAASRGPLLYNEDGLSMPCDPHLGGDVVLARKDTPASYYLCATHDDAVQGVTFVTRGIDLQAATSVQRVIQAVMGWPAPAYAHHRLLVDASGRRLAKRDGARTLRTLRTEGFSARSVLRQFDQFQ